MKFTGLIISLLFVAAACGTDYEQENESKYQDNPDTVAQIVACRESGGEPFWNEDRRGNIKSFLGCKKE
jgi:hypothetical protein